MLNDDLIVLRALEAEDYELVRNWRFSEEAYDYFYEWQPQSKANNQAWIQSILNRKDEINFMFVAIRVFGGCSGF